ncbi:MAG: magnesium/cobalt efflux protein [Candidatus Midichloriaceae bacterium]|jgi:CBS domain containing-hemolysin-like protein|nr:magnesium/cobalt efflux protein [Candidatus Midichloriaceae bacterium]
MNSSVSKNNKAKRVGSVFSKVAKLLRFKRKDAYLELPVLNILEQKVAENSYEEERNIIKNILAFGDLEASDVMINRAEIIAVSSGMKLTEIKKIFINEGHSRLPIYKSNLDDIEGFIHIKDLFKASLLSQKDKPSVDSLIRDIIFVPETIKLTELLKKMKNKKIHIAIVLDEHGGTSGLVTIEDIVEELVGDIKDEHDVHEEKQLIDKDGDAFIIDASAEVEEVGAALGYDFVDNEDDPEYETIGGFIITKLGHIPKEGAKLKVDKWEFEVLEASARRVKKIRAYCV